jgi:hypothetical protein
VRPYIGDIDGIVMLMSSRPVFDDQLGKDRSLTPEEDSVGDPEETDDEVDDMLPADLWF